VEEYYIIHHIILLEEVHLTAVINSLPKGCKKNSLPNSWDQLKMSSCNSNW